MMTRRRLTVVQRREIARERAKGGSTSDIAARFGVSRQTIYATVRQLKGTSTVDEAGTRVMGVRVSESELRAFDDAINRHGVSRSEAIKRLMTLVGEAFVPGADESAEMKRLAAAVNRMGGNINQTARALNEARLKGQPLPYTATQHAELRAALTLVFKIADQVQALARSRRRHLDDTVMSALSKEGPDDAAP